MAGWVRTVVTFGDVDGVANSSDTLTVPAGVTVPVNDHLIIAGAAGGAKVISSITDSKSNSYQVDKTGTNGTGNGASIASAKITTQLVAGDTITVTWSGSNDQRALAVEQYTGLASSLWFDKAASGTGTSTSPATAATATTAQADELIFGAIEIGGGLSRPTFTAGTNFTKRSQVSSNNTSNSARDIATEDRIVAATGTYTASGTLSTSNIWTALVCTYKLSSSTTTPVSLTATATSSATLTKIIAYQRSLNSTAGNSASVARLSSYLRALSASSPGTASMSRASSYFRTLLASASNSTILTKGQQFFKTLVATAGSSAALVKVTQFFKTLSTTVGSSTVLARVASYQRSLSSSAGSVASLTRIGSYLRTLSASSPVSGSMSRVSSRLMTLLASAGSLAVLTRGAQQYFQTLVATAGSAVSISRPVTRIRSMLATAGSAATFIADTWRSYAVRIQATAIGSGSMRRDIRATIKATASTTAFLFVGHFMTLKTTANNSAAIIRRVGLKLGAQAGSSVIVSQGAAYSRTLVATVVSTPQIKRQIRMVLKAASVASTILLHVRSYFKADPPNVISLDQSTNIVSLDMPINTIDVGISTNQITLDNSTNTIEISEA